MSNRVMNAQWLMFFIAFALMGRNHGVVQTKSYVYTQIGDLPKNYDTAKSICESRNLSLSLVQSEDDKGELAKYLHCNGITDTIWIGLKLPAQSLDPSDFVWVDNTPISWTNFGDGADKLKDEKCVMMKPDFLWYTRSCNLQSHHIVCQRATAVSVIHPATPSNAQFTRVFNLQPDGQPMAVHNPLSLISCAAHCLRHKSCDVIVLRGSGHCSLFRFTPALVPANAPSNIRVYQKKCPPT